jgi:acetyl esterase/lipase
VAVHNFPVQIREVAAAMELIYQNATNWNVDISRIAIMGFSAGGHLAAHYTNAYDCQEVRAVFPESKPVQASVLCYPVITSAEGLCHPGSFQKLVGHFPLTQEENAKFSCDRLVTEKTPPTFLWHTFADKTVPVVNSLLYAQALSAHNVPFALHIYPYGHHGLATVDQQTNGSLSPAFRLAADWLPQLKQWLKVVFA